VWISGYVTTVRGVVCLMIRPMARGRQSPHLSGLCWAQGWPVAMHCTPTEVVARCIEEYHTETSIRD
jgi:hypothetical protein